MKIVIAVASPRESDYVATDDRITQIIIGIGKLNAYAAIADFFQGMSEEQMHEYIIINAGSCGSLRHPIGTALIINYFEQGDTYTSPDFVNNTHWLHQRNTTLQPKCTCLTSDRFISAHYLKEQHMPIDEYDAFEMESYALALFAYRYNIPFYCMKMVSDNCDGTLKDWASIMNEIRPRLTSMIEQKCNEFLTLTLENAYETYGLDNRDEAK